MAVDRFTFYARHYSEIANLLELHEDICNTYPVELGALLEDSFQNVFDARSFAGLSDWDCEYERSQDCFSFWNPRFYDYDRDRGAYFCIYYLSDATEHIDKRKIASRVQCELYYWGKRGPDSLTANKLELAARHDTKRLKRAGHFESQEHKGCYVQVPVGDLLHVSAFEAREQNFAELTKRTEKLVRACLPVIERAAAK
jgi:hypothetical protein